MAPPAGAARRTVGGHQGQGVRVAVIDTGVDTVNPQLKPGRGRLRGRRLPDAGEGRRRPQQARQDQRHRRRGGGTARRWPGIIAARPARAPASSVSRRRPRSSRSGRTTRRTAARRRRWPRRSTHAVAKGAHVINISQDTTQALSADSDLAQAVRKALEADVVVVASAGNDGLDGKGQEHLPRGLPRRPRRRRVRPQQRTRTVSQAGPFLGVAAPGVDIVSTVPGGGQCTDNGTSFSRSIRGGRGGAAARQVPLPGRPAGRRPHPADRGTLDQRTGRLPSATGCRRPGPRPGGRAGDMAPIGP